MIDPYWLTIIIILAVVFVVGVFMLIECSEGFFHKDRRSGDTSPSSPYIIGSHFTEFKDKVDVEANFSEKLKESKPNPIGGLFTHLHRGSQSLHAQGLCNHGGGAWGTVTSVSGRSATKNIWSPVSGGIYDCCQCEDNGGFH